MLNMGNRSLLLVAGYRIYYWIGFTLQSRPTPKSLSCFLMPSMVSINHKRDWLHYYGPICPSRFLNRSRISSMRVTEQIDAMEVSGTNPFKYLVVTRIMATTLCCLLVFWRCYSSFGSYLVENIKETFFFALFQSSF
jgi:phospholipid/cholesterol/gamma-HCH transport system permease protein